MHCCVLPELIGLLQQATTVSSKQEIVDEHNSRFK